MIITEYPKSRALQICFVCDEKVIRLEVQRTRQLRDIQKHLCEEFRKEFPLMCAVLINAEMQTFAEFIDIVADG